MTLETAKSKIRMSVVVNKDHIKSLEKSDELIDQIFNDHEVLLKEAYELKSIAYDLLLEAVKLKDEEIERLKAEFLICKKRYTQKAVEGKELKKALSIALRKQLKEQQ